MFEQDRPVATRQTAERWMGAVAGALLALGPGSAIAEPHELTLCAASVGGTWSLIGTGVDAALREAYPGSVVTIQTSAGGIANAASLERGGCDIAIMHPPEIVLARAGDAPFREPIDDLRLLARLEAWSPIQFMVTKSFAQEHGLETVADIAKAKAPIRFVLPKPGNIAHAVSADILARAGASAEQIEEWGGSIYTGASVELGNLVRDRRADGGSSALFPGAAQVLDIANSVPLTLLSIPEDIRAEVNEKWNVPDYTIPADTYDFLDRDVVSVTLGAHLVALASMPDETVAAILTAVVDNPDMIRGVHPSMDRLDPADFPRSKLQYHDAARGFYETRGMAAAD